MALILFLVLGLCMSCLNVDARSEIQPNEQIQESILDSIDDDFDCIDIYKQPALQHPLLKNHKIQFNPTFARNTLQSSPSYAGKDFKGCSSGKVPIHKTTWRHQVVGNLFSKTEDESFHICNQSCPGHHFATLETTQNMTFYGANAKIGGYNLSLQANQYSLSQIWIQSGPTTELNSIQVGTGVHPSLYKDSHLRITAYWTADGFVNTGCFNTLCPGFVQVNQNPYYALGAVLPDVSSIGSLDKKSMPTTIQQDQATGHWWLAIGIYSKQVGYWPKEIFTHLSTGASKIKYGGETFAPPNMVSPPMGSGRLPEEFFRNSGFFGKLEIVDVEYNVTPVSPKDMKSICDTSSNCYDLLYEGYEGPVFRQAFLYGGPGGQCST